MAKKIRLLGLEFFNYPLREELQIAQEALDDEKLQIILTVSMQSLVKAGELRQVAECVEQADLVVADDPEILRAAGITSVQRIREAEDHLFFKELMKRLQRLQRRVYIAASRTAALEKALEVLAEHYEKLPIAGTYSIEEYPDMDRMINEINSAAPDVILSVMPTPEQEEFLAENRGKLLARLWYGLGEDCGILLEKKGLLWRVRRLIRLGMFRMHVNEYEDGSDG